MPIFLHGARMTMTTTPVSMSILRSIGVIGRVVTIRMFRGLAAAGQEDMTFSPFGFLVVLSRPLLPLLLYVNTFLSPPNTPDICHEI
jgi:hypothetical protein